MNSVILIEVDIGSSASVLRHLQHSTTRKGHDPRDGVPPSLIGAGLTRIHPSAWAEVVMSIVTVNAMSPFNNFFVVAPPFREMRT